jgi:hypothetical protein
MNILLLNTNPVVSRLLSLCIRKEDMVLEEITDLSMVKRDKYDIAFIDDNAYVPEVQDVLPNLMIGKKIFLSGKLGSVVALEDFDEVITKPFLPSQITAVIERFSHNAEVMEEHKEESFIFPLSQEERRDETAQTEEELEKAEKTEKNIEMSQDPEVLDSHEIERIKALLEEDEDEDDEEVLQIEDEEAYEARKVEVITEHLEADGLEIISEDEIISILSTKPKKKKTNKKKTKKEKKKRSKKAEKEETYTFEEALIAAIEGMKPKKIRKLLKDAEVTIKINFKDKK